MRLNFIYVWALTLLLVSAHSTWAADNPILRFPDVHGDTVVFVYGEDIWSAPVEGGTATRLTIHDGRERHPNFSPDGQLIAFTGEYGGNADIYVMNRYGGQITRVTYHPGNDQVVGWHPVKNKILFSSRRHSYSRFSHLFLISPDGTGLEELILNEASQGSFSPDGKQIAYNKVAREHRAWKRYKGGLAQEVYVYNFETNQEKNISNFIGTDRLPMWLGDKIYFSSDRDRFLNIYAYEPASEKITQLTHHHEYDIRRPNMGDQRIVYELGGALWLLDVTNGKNHKIDIQIKTDVPEVRPDLINVKDYIQGFDCSPDGKRALIVARGEVFTVPQKNGPTRNLTGSSGIREQDAVWSPDGKTIAYLGDKSGELEIYLVDPRAQKEPRQLTTHQNGYRHTLRWSPDSKKIAFTDQTLRCYVLDVETGKISVVDKAEYEHIDVSLKLKPIYDFTWSPDSRYLAYSKMNADLVYQLYIYELQANKTHHVGNGLFNDFQPAFSQDGRRLFFVSMRRFEPVFCDFEWEMVYKKSSGVYCLTLQSEDKPFLPFESDEELQEDPKDEKVNPVKIDFDDLYQRIEALPLSQGNYRNLTAGKNTLFYLNKETGDFNRFEFREMGARDLYAFDFKNRKEQKVIENIDGYKLSANSSHIVYRQGNNIGLIPADARNNSGNNLNLSNLKMWLDPRAEWDQIFHEAWRMHRDFFYDSNMHGLDWKAVGDKYASLLSRASCRQDLNYILGELVGELNTSHTYVYGGDIRRRAPKINIGMLGVDWEIDPVAKRYRLKKIYRVADWTRGIFPPLNQVGAKVKEGDYLLKVNGREVTTANNIYSYFQDLAGEQVTLSVNSAPSCEGAKKW